MSDYVYNQAARKWEEEPDDEDGDKCQECGQKNCVCDQIDGLDYDDFDGLW